MSCNGCRVLRKGCSESCVLRPCLQWIDGAEPQGHATVFVAKFFGRAGLMSFISSVPESHRPALFQSLLFEACGRTVNPVNGAVGLLWTGRWHVCQAAVESVLRGGVLRPMADAAPAIPLVDAEEAEESCTTRVGRSWTAGSLKRKAGECVDNHTPAIAAAGVAVAGDRKLPMLLPVMMQAGDMFSPGLGREMDPPEEKRRSSSPSEGSVTMSGESDRRTTERKLLNLFV